MHRVSSVARIGKFSLWANKTKIYHALAINLAEKIMERATGIDPATSSLRIFYRI
jgi:hypothetical protein